MIKEDFFHFKSSQQQYDPIAIKPIQLEAMFAATDEEMRQTEQPVECLIERTKHKTRGVQDFSPTNLCSSRTYVNLKSKKRNAPTAVKPSIVLMAWRSTYDVMSSLLHSLQATITSNDSGWALFIGKWTFNT